MNRVLQLVFAVVVASQVTVATAVAQTAHLGLGGGLIAPLSDYKNVDNAGWHVLGKVDFAIPLSPVSVRVDALFGQTKHKDVGGTPVDGKTQLIGGLVNLVYKIPVPAPIVKPYLIGGGGIYNVKTTLPGAVPPVDTSETKFTWDLGAGATFGAGPAKFFVEARYVTIQESGGSTKFIPVTAGLSFGGK
ncbi:MAG TPA: outer membrane beta-barrel protein [Gemmatimonadales bacterium]|nr:outer membrane beta-barrel protein [Gemmatimonadales bacterium]